MRTYLKMILQILCGYELKITRPLYNSTEWTISLKEKK